MKVINAVIRFVILSIGFSVVYLPVHGQIEVDQNNNVDLRSGEAIITDNKVDLMGGEAIVTDEKIDLMSGEAIITDDEINLRSGEVIMNDNQVNFWSGTFLLEDDYVKIAPNNTGMLFKEHQFQKTFHFGNGFSYTSTFVRPAIFPSVTSALGGAYGSDGAIGLSQNRWSDVYTLDLHYTNLYSASDSNFKKNVETVSNGLNKVMQMNPVKYRYNAEYYNHFSPDSVQVNPDSLQNRKQMGFIAQEMNEVMPNAVMYRENEKESTGSYMFSQEDVVPVLTNAIQQQQQMIENLQTQVDSLQSEIQGCCE